MGEVKTLDKTGLNYFWQRLKVLLDGKVEKISGKGLSANDYTNTDKANLASLVKSIKGCVYEISRQTVSVAASGWTRNASGMYEKAVDVANATASGRIRWALQESMLGVVLVAGVKCTSNGKITIVCLTQPSTAFEMTFVVEGVRA